MTQPHAMNQATRPSRDARVKELDRMTKRDLAAMCAAGIHRPDGGRTVVEGGAGPVASWTKDEIVSTILGIEYPGAHSIEYPGAIGHEIIGPEWSPVYRDWRATCLCGWGTDGDEATVSQATTAHQEETSRA